MEFTITSVYSGSVLTTQASAAAAATYAEHNAAAETFRELGQAQATLEALAVGETWRSSWRSHLGIKIERTS